MYMYYKNCNYYFKYSSFITKMKFVISIFCAINRITIDEAYYFKISRVLDFVLTAISTIREMESL